MALSVVNDGVQLAAYEPRLYSESDYYNCYGDRSNLASGGSNVLTGYETLDSPPNYDFYANTEAWGRRRQFRPSLFQLYAKPEVRVFALYQI